jgi:hypothetical protein
VFNVSDIGQSVGGGDRYLQRKLPTFSIKKNVLKLWLLIQSYICIRNTYDRGFYFQKILENKGSLLLPIYIIFWLLTLYYRYKQHKMSIWFMNRAYILRLDYRRDEVYSLHHNLSTFFLMLKVVCMY